MDFELEDEQKLLQARAIGFAQRFLNAGLAERESAGQFHREGWSLCAQHGYLGLTVPTEYHGLGLSASDALAVLEGLGHGCRDQGLLFAINAQLWAVATPILQYGTVAQKQKYLVSLCDGTAIGANGSTEPEAGSDVFAMRTRAERQAESYVLNGTKIFVSNASVADLFLIYATMDPSRGVLGISAFLVERNTPGLHVGPPTKKMGLRTSAMADVTLDNCLIPHCNRLGRAGRGAEIFELAMEWERGCILATAVGHMQWQLAKCIEHARSRRQFGQPISKFQSVANLIVDMKVRLDTCRAMLYRVGYNKDRGRAAAIESAMAKLHISESYVQSCLDAIRIFGGAGYMAELGLERDMRDAIGSLIYSGTSDIQRNIIAKCLRL